MQLYVTVKPDLPAGGPYANMNPGDGKPFGVIEFGDNAYVSVKSDDEARRIIAAAAALIEMRKMIGTPHEFEPTCAGSVVEFSHCARCGMLGDSEDHAKRCRSCEIEPVTEGDFCEACAPAALLADSIAAGMPLLVTDDDASVTR